MSDDFAPKIRLRGKGRLYAVGPWSSYSSTFDPATGVWVERHESGTHNPPVLVAIGDEEPDAALSEQGE